MEIPHPVVLYSSWAEALFCLVRQLQLSSILVVISRGLNDILHYLSGETDGNIFIITYLVSQGSQICHIAILRWQMVPLKASGLVKPVTIQRIKLVNNKIVAWKVFLINCL